MCLCYNRGGQVCVGAGHIWDIFISCTKFLCVPKLKDKMHFVLEKKASQEYHCGRVDRAATCDTGILYAHWFV